MRRKLFDLTANMPCRLISRDATPYLERYFVGKFLGYTVYLHRFVNGDGDAEVHDHPWNAVSFVLAGSYLEERVTQLSPMHGWFSTNMIVHYFNRVRSTDFHRIVSTEPETWTLFIHGPAKRNQDYLFKGWGFLKKEKNTVVYHKPFEMTNGCPWWETAPLGIGIGRAPYRESK